MAQVLAAGTTACLFQIDRSTPFEVATISSLTQMSMRSLEYDGQGKFEALVLRRQSWLGDGQRLPQADLFPAGQKPPTLARLIASTAATATSSTGVARSDTGRVMAKAIKTANAQQRQGKRAAAQAALHVRLQQWRSQATNFRCCEQVGGTIGCDRTFNSLAGWREHCRRAGPAGYTNQHRSGLHRTFIAGAPIGREDAASAQRRAVATQSAVVAQTDGNLAQQQATELGADTAGCYTCILCDGTQWSVPPPISGYASPSRLPSNTKSACQIQFCVWAGHDIKHAGLEGLRGNEAKEAMGKVGACPTLAQCYASVPGGYAAVQPGGKPRVPRPAVLEPSELTPLLMESRVKLEARLKKLWAKEQTIGGPKAKPKAKAKATRTAAPAGGGGKRRKAVAPTLLSRETPLTVTLLTGLAATIDNCSLGAKKAQVLIDVILACDVAAAKAARRPPKATCQQLAQPTDIGMVENWRVAARTAVHKGPLPVARGLLALADAMSARLASDGAASECGCGHEGLEATGMAAAEAASGEAAAAVSTAAGGRGCETGDSRGDGGSSDDSGGDYNEDAARREEEDGCGEEEEEEAEEEVEEAGGEEGGGEEDEHAGWDGWPEGDDVACGARVVDEEVGWEEEDEEEEEAEEVEEEEDV